MHVKHSSSTRRRFLAGFSGISALFLAGCGGDSNDGDEQGIGADDPEITLSVSFDYNGEWALEYTYEGAAGEESDIDFGASSSEVTIPGDATYVEADLDISRHYEWPTQGRIGLTLKSNNTTIDSDSAYGMVPECHVEGRTQ